MTSPEAPSDGPPSGEIALTIVQDGQQRHITVRELAVGNKIAVDALLALLIEKGLITREEFQAKIRHLSESHYRPGSAPANPSSGLPDENPTQGDGAER